MGKSSAPATPDYKGQAIATGNTGKYNEVGPTGSVGWSVRPGADPVNPQPGDYIRTTEFSPEQQQLYDSSVQNQLRAGEIGGQQLEDLSGGTQAVQDALYRRSTQYYDTNFGNEEEALRTRLANQGIGEGSTGYDRALEQLTQRKDSAYADATDRAITGADASKTSSINQLASILAMSRGQNPTSANSAGGNAIDLAGATDAQYNAELGGVNAKNAQVGQQNQALGTLALYALSYY